MHSEIVEFLNKTVPGANAEHIAAEVGDDSIFVNPEHIYKCCEELRYSSQWDFNVLQVITGCDYSDRIEVSYILASFTKNLELILKVKLPKSSPSDTPEIDSVCELWVAANFQERECYDMVGVIFKNHPDFRRILCPDDWEGFPLRKDYVVQKTYRGMEVNPPEKVNTDDHYFGDRLKRESEEPKKVSVSWKVPEFEEQKSE